MKKKYLILGLFAVSSVYGFGQKNVNPYTKKKISRSSVELVYSHYIQDGNHSAVTGGTGTEELYVYSPEIIYHKTIDSLSSYSIDMGIDVITSASTDRIDFVMSSASKTDGHGYLSLGYDRKLKKNRNITLGGSFNSSLESDYLSFGGNLSANVVNMDHSKEFSAQFEAYFDDLRWGRLNGIRPLRLVYPQELRYREWYNTKKRKSFNLSLGFKHTINNKMIAGIFPGIEYQRGLLATPFQRVYFIDSSLRVENLPYDRIKIPIGIQLNSFIGKRYILKNYYRFYWDNFGIIAHTFNTEFSIKMTPGIVLTPMLRLYSQNGTSYFKPYRLHNTSEKYYTSDYDLSSFQSFEAGLEVNFSGLGKGKEITQVNNIGLRYSYYKRSDGLYAHIITALFNIGTIKEKIHRNNLSWDQAPP
jgi:Protein of unknown function (DUF3570)